MGYSMGAGVAFQLAVQNPATVRRLVLVSAGYAQDGFYAEMLPMQAQVGAGMAEMMKDTPMYKGYVAVAPKPEDFPKLLDQMGAFMRKPYDWSADVSKLTMPVMLVYGDGDMFRPEHIVKFYQLLGGGLKDAGWQREHMSKNHSPSCRTSPITKCSWHRNWRELFCRFSTARVVLRPGANDVAPRKLPLRKREVPFTR